MNSTPHPRHDRVTDHDRARSIATVRARLRGQTPPAQLVVSHRTTSRDHMLRRFLWLTNHSGRDV